MFEQQWRRSVERQDGAKPLPESGEMSPRGDVFGVNPKASATGARTKSFSKGEINLTWV